MKLSATELQGIVELLGRLCLELSDVEQRYALLVGRGDPRPRIEYFQDAVRAFISGGIPPERLTIERLAYDVSALRYLQSKPLATLRPHGAGAGDGTQLVRRDATPAPSAPDRSTRQRLSDLYQQYGVLFAALLKPVADRDFLDRQEDLNAQVEEYAEMIQSHPEQTAALKANIATADQELHTIDKAHGDYSMAQLGLYEVGKDVVKELAARGFNLAGKFVQEAMTQTANQGRGRS